MKNYDLIQLHNALAGILMLKDENQLKGGKFSYAVNKNIERIFRDHSNKKVQTKFAPIAEYKAYITEERQLRASCLIESTEKDEKGNTKKSFDDKKFETELVVLKEKYKDVLAKQKEIDDAYNKFLEEDNKDVIIYKISSEYLPVNITPKQVESIWEIIESEEK